MKSRFLLETVVDVSTLAAVTLMACISCRRTEIPEAQNEETPVAASAAPPQKRPNVLLISIDTLRPDHLGCYGYERQTSPRIDRLAAEGVLFENHISSTSWTLPAHAAMFTSLSDFVHGCTDSDKSLHKNLVTLAERFSATGYETAGFFSGPFLHPVFGFGQGFGLYQNCTSYAQSMEGRSTESWSPDADTMRKSHRDISNPTVYEAFRRWFDSRKGKNFFAFVHLFDVHFDFIPPAPYNKMFDPDYDGPMDNVDFFYDPRVNADMPRRDLEHLIALYDGEIAWTDHHVGLMVDDLAEAGLLDDTVVVITADHGTEFFEHHLKGHRLTLFDEVIRIPLIIRFPARLDPAVRVKAQTRMVDLGPTLLDLAGLRPAKDVQGASLVPLAGDADYEFDAVAVSELFSVGRNLRTIRTTKWKYFDDMAGGQQFYVDLLSDPREQRPSAAVLNPPGRRYMNRYLKTVQDQIAWRRRLDFSQQESQSALPEEVLEQLESLGYIESD